MIIHFQNKLNNMSYRPLETCAVKAEWKHVQSVVDNIALNSEFYDYII